MPYLLLPFLTCWFQNYSLFIRIKVQSPKKYLKVNSVNKDGEGTESEEETGH